jgi:hypothetical protein
VYRAFSSTSQIQSLVLSMSALNRSSLPPQPLLRGQALGDVLVEAARPSGGPVSSKTAEPLDSICLQDPSRWRQRPADLPGPGVG